MNWKNYGLVLKRYEGYEKDPWQIETVLLTQGKELDTPLIIEKDYAVESTAKESIIFGNKNLANFKWNAILYLFETEDLEVSPLIRTQIIRFV
jgi:hypothetical protein